ncbi:urea transporter [Empedobacter sp.]|uniref:urea transporter n=1 Tax=Empedobacter sp. TaxID=1927715 RepID=UPI000E83813F|nr:urea transporter [Empedobacter sp.]HBX62788.1 urea transporter [Flavobacteriaceae bacterium]
MEFILQPWPWYIGGPIIAIVMLLLIYFGKSFGFSSNFRTICSALGGGKSCDFFSFDWKSQKWNLLFLVGAIIGGFVSVHFFIKRNIPVFTLPFILLTWCLIYGIHHFTTIGPATAGNTQTLLETNDLFTSTNGFGEVIFQGGPMSGIIFFIAVFIGSPAAALYGLAASIFSAEISNLFGEPVEQIHMGLFGFNAVLTAIVFAGTKRIDGFWVLLGVFITVLIDVLFVKTNIFASFGGVLTFPFVLGTWCTLFIKKYTDRFFGI